MKFSGAVLLWITFTLTGMKASLLLKKRVTVLEESVVFLDSLMNEIKYSKINIISIIDKFSKEPSMKSLTFLNAFVLTLNDSDFYGRWADSLSSYAYYKSDEREKMLQLGSILGTTDAISQNNAISLYKSYFENYKTNALEDYEKYGKLSPLFGLFVGASVFILLI